MAEDIQGLLDKIRTDGIERAESEKEQIISDARKQAEEILANAKAEAEKIRKTAAEEAVVSENKGKAAVQQAARDIIIALNADLQKRLEKTVKACTADAMTPELMGRIILEMVKAYSEKNPESTPELEILVQKADADALQKALSGSLREQLKADPVIRIGNDFESGLQIGFKGTDVYFDFTDEAVSEIVCRFVGPKLAAVIRG